MICAPSFLSSDFTKLKEEIQSINAAKWLHFDVMDGKFVKNKTYDHTMLPEIAAYSNQVFDCHLMVEKPEDVVDHYIKNKADYITFHYEATDKALDLIHHIKASGVKAGISIKPNTPVKVLDDLLAYVDMILVMSVEPGKGGQAFIPSSIEKIAYLNEQRIKHRFNYQIEVDGGINHETAKMVKDAGCDIIVVGSYIFKHTHRNERIRSLENV